jgi:tetratricopeptide (TPR) repeat protein
MKTLQITIVLFFMMGITHAQSPQYATAMKENLEKMGAWSEAPQTLAATFERIAQAEKNQWLPYYYAAYATIIQSFSIKEADVKDKTLDHAQSMLDNAFILQPDSSECMALQGFLYIAKLQVDPMSRGAEYSTKANEAFEQAIKLNPENPRGYYLKGMTVLNTPDFYGGGKVPAKPILTQAVAKFEAFKPASPFAPDWGKQDCQKQLAACQ